MVRRDQYSLPIPNRVLHTDVMTTAEYATIFDDLASEIAQHYHRGRVLIAIDGVSGKSTDQFADSLAAAMPARSRSVIRTTSESGAAAGSHDFSFPRNESYQADDDYSLLRNIVLRFRDANVAEGTSLAAIPADAMLIVAGRFLLRPELRGFWHFGVWLEGDTHLSDESVEAQIRYTRDGAPRSAAHAIFDVTKPEAPARVWADSC